jgi:anti-sigma regulatory factor (Ser/Thr protein kinase)
VPATPDDCVALATGLHAPAHARAWLAERAASLPPTLLDDALLVASELVTNAVRHGRPQIVLSLRYLPDGVRIAVGDEGEHIPVRTFGTPSIDRPTGRGLLIVAATARDWGVAPHPDGRGKTVWAELTRS